MSFVQMIYSTFQGVLFFYFSYSTLYSFILSIASVFRRSPKVDNRDFNNNICVFIPAYKENEVILSTVHRALQLNYPANKFSIVVIADTLTESTISQLKKLPIEVIEAEFEKSTKVKALNAAFGSISNHFDGCVILDADNLINKDFLIHANKLLNAGYLSVQGIRLEKEADAQMSYLDGLSEAINTNIFRRGSFNLGLSASISGSGYLANYVLLKDILSDMDSVSGFDKELEIRLLQKGVKTIFSDDLVIFDEKVANQKDFKNQRRRWIFSQYFYLMKYLAVSFKALLKFNIALWNSAFLRHAQLPRFLNLVFLLLFSVLFSVINVFFHIDFIYWPLLFGLNVLSIVFAIPRRFYSKKMILAMVQLPRTFFNMFGLLFNLRGTNKKFIHTPHGKKE